MQITDLTVEVRNANLERVGQLLPEDLVGFTAVLRFNNVGNWKVNLPATHAMADALRAPGAGLIVTGPNGVILSGPTTGATRTQTTEDPTGEWEITGVDDSVLLGERLAYPTPTTADLTLQTSDYDTRTGKASTVIYGYVRANVGSTAPAARKLSTLTLAADGALGSTVTGKARFDTLGELLKGIAAIDGLGFDITQQGSNLVFSVFAPADRSATVRMDIDNNRLTKTEYRYSAPTATRAIVAGSGSGAARTLVEVTTSDSTTAETAWGRRIEAFTDSRSTAVTAELTQAGKEALAEKGKTLTAISVSPTDDMTMAFGTDWNLGDKVSVVAGSDTLTQIVTEVGLLISEDGVRIGATVGLPAVADPESEVVEATSDQETRISNLERNDAPAADSTKANLNGWTAGRVMVSNGSGTLAADAAVTTTELAFIDGVTSNVQTQLNGKASTASVALKADIASPTFTGVATAPQLLLTSTTDVSHTSTAHGLQIGASTGANLRMDVNEIMASNNGVAAGLYLQNDGGTLYVGNNVAGALDVNGPIAGTNIYGSGNFYSGGLTTSTGWQSGADGCIVASGLVYSVNTSSASLALSRKTDNGNVAQFYRGSTTIVGSISVTTAATAYNTSSDYRLKENVVPIGNPCERVMALRPVRFNFIHDEDHETVDGFLAHEAQAVVPNAVTGIKDEVDADGEPVYQAIDHSKLVPLLTSALQEALAKIDSLETRISALESR